MLSVIVCSHSCLALGIKKSAEMILGKQSNFFSLGFKEGEDFFAYKEKICKIAKREFKAGNKVCCLTDLPNATPFNCCVLALSEFEEDCKIVSGVSLPMVLELLLKRETTNNYDEVLNSSIEAAKQGLWLTSVKEFTAQEGK
ncbi:MAG: PTS sugar transporter subunit IIA [Erysipelotrichaceae bacterium]